MLKKFISKRNSIMWVIAIGSVIIPLTMKNRYFQDIAIMTFLWAGLASSWNLYSGYCKRLSIGHAAFLGIGAYTSTILYMTLGVSPWIGMIAGAILSGLFALLLGGSTLRLRGTFFTLTTIAFCELLKIITNSAEKLTGGSMGLLLPFKPGFMNMTWRGKIAYILIIWLYMLVVLYLSARLEKSKFGYYLTAIGENQEAAESLGVDPTSTMLKSFVLSAVFTSIGGTLFAQYIMFIEPESTLGMTSSMNFILVSIVGGMGTAFGPFVGSMILTPLSNVLRGYLSNISGLHGFIFGLVLVLILLYKPDGIYPQLRDFIKRAYAKTTTVKKVE